EGSRGAVGQVHPSMLLPGAGTRAGGKSNRGGRGRWRQDALRARQPDIVTASRGRSPQACPSLAAGSPARAGRSLCRRASGARQDVLARTPDSLFSAREEALLVEGLALAEQVVHGPP